MEALLRAFRTEMEQTPQDPIWHAEGNVWEHTKLVLEALETLEGYQQSDSRNQMILRMAAIFHDVGKIRTTRQEDGRWVAPGHSRVSAEIARQTLWLERGFCGTEDALAVREAVCGLIRYHALPVHAIDEADGKLRLLRLASNGTLASGLTVENLCILARADILGRQCPDQALLLEKVALCEELAREAGCLSGPYPFPTGHTQRAYLAGRNIPADYPLYEDTWGTVLMMSGLPGTGKDTWIQNHCPQLPMVSLDEIRKTRHIAPTDDQRPVLEEARKQAKEYLRAHQSFVWNATNLSPFVRKKQIDLFSAYGAAVKIIYMETDWAEQMRRNRERAVAVPENAICRMLEILSPPEAWEAHWVQWNIALFEGEI